MKTFTITKNDFCLECIHVVISQHGAGTEILDIGNNTISGTSIQPLHFLEGWNLENLKKLKLWLLNILWENIIPNVIIDIYDNNLFKEVEKYVKL